MQEIKRALLEDGWVVCEKCGHKLGRVVGDKPPTGIEIKCHSCKAINLVNRPKKRSKKTRKTSKAIYNPSLLSLCEIQAIYEDLCRKTYELGIESKSESGWK